MVNPRELLQSGDCVVEASDPREALRCGCHSYQSDFKGSLVGPCELVRVGDRIYATGNLTNSIIELNITTGESNHHRIPTARSVPMGLTNNGRLWFTEFNGDKIGKFDPSSGEFDEIQIPSNGIKAGPVAVDVDRRNTAWFTAMLGNYVGRIQNGTIDTFNLPPNGVIGPRGLEVLSDRVIVAANGANELLSLDKETGEVRESAEFDVANGNPIDVHVNTSTNIAYVTLGLGDGVAQVDLDNMEVLQIFNLGEGSRPSRLDTDSNGNIWATEIIDNEISHINVDTGNVVGHTAPLPLSSPEGINVDGRDNVWFVMWAADSIARYNISADEFTVFNIEGKPEIFASQQVTSVIHEQLQQNRQLAEQLIKRPFSTPNLTLINRFNSIDIISGINAIESALGVYANTGNDRRAVIELIDNLPQRTQVTENDRVILGYSGWINVLNIIITYGFIGTIQRWLQLIISVINGWIEHKLDP